MMIDKYYEPYPTYAALFADSFHLSTFLFSSLLFSSLLFSSLLFSLFSLSSLFTTRPSVATNSVTVTATHSIYDSYTYGYSSLRAESEESMPLFRLKLGVAPTSDGISCARNAGVALNYTVLHYVVTLCTALCSVSLCQADLQICTFVYLQYVSICLPIYLFSIYISFYLSPHLILICWPIILPFFLFCPSFYFLFSQGFRQRLLTERFK